VMALAQAGTAARNASVFITLEPCCHTGKTGPCVDALISAGVKRVVAAVVDPNPQVSGNGFAALREAGIVVDTGLLAAEATQINRGFISRMQRGRPFVCSKIAASLDGRTALANGQSQWITSADSRQDVQRMRSGASAILTGVGTVIADNPQMNVRIEHDDSWRQPARLIVDSALRTPSDSKILDEESIIFTQAGNDHPGVQALRDKGVQIETLGGDDHGVCLDKLMSRLGQSQYNEVMVEAGPRLNGALLQAGLLDELVVYQAPHVLGPDARPMFGLPVLTDMSQRRTFTLQSTRQIGPDWRMQYLPTGER
ncbi:MAG: bifunctional diaminohydroxyphosphoribosylaminopyrimidine deaminase/5-amino-6-(5-phosphoribosylamino)uracil reductase RibD, partial [Gammaproteobacteria bacterium]|nr:bifunctional diaminohydroxyphosphoribosylaminopyrimidine deaminase/5-amino-6-(5-phosphoribosylamino)uracil reductase RibD [Gammaproteobacteria bacterium]